MIKSYQTIKDRHGIPRKMATIICDNCRKEFDVPEDNANEGRRYCDKVCSAEGRGFTIHKLGRKLAKNNR